MAIYSDWNISSDIRFWFDVFDLDWKKIVFVKEKNSNRIGQKKIDMITLRAKEKRKSFLVSDKQFADGDDSKFRFLKVTSEKKTESLQFFILWHKFQPFGVR